MPGADVIGDGPNVPFGVDQHALAAPAIAEAGSLYVDPAEPVLETLQP